MSFEILDEPQGSFGKFYNQGESAFQIWFENLTKLKRFILGHNRRPNLKSENLEEKYLAIWERVQLHHSRHGLRKGMMIHDAVFQAWKDFLSS